MMIFSAKPTQKGGKPAPAPPPAPMRALAALAPALLLLAPAAPPAAAAGPPPRPPRPPAPAEVPAGLAARLYAAAATEPPPTQTPTRTPRVVGGAAVEDPDEAYPHVAAFMLPGSGRAFCSGTLISSECVLTAGHCVDDLSYRGGRRGLSLMLGGAALPFRADCGGPKKKVAASLEVHAFSKADVLLHPAYFDDAGLPSAADLAVVRLRKRSKVRPATIDLQRAIEEASPDATVVGFGVSDVKTGYAPCTVHAAKVPLHSAAKCDAMPYGGTDCATECRRMICAGEPTTDWDYWEHDLSEAGKVSGRPRDAARRRPLPSLPSPRSAANPLRARRLTLRIDQDACSGDSGGPLFSAAGALVGVTSYGPQVCGFGDPAKVRAGAGVAVGRAARRD